MGHKLEQVYWLTFALMVISLVVVHRILKSQLGRAFEYAAAGGVRLAWGVSVIPLQRSMRL
jgi:hypothetical protein